jgi:hypothetical protein
MNYQQFRSLVNRMRVAQKTYFAQRTGDALQLSKQLEAEVDKALREYDEGQKNFLDKQESA